MTIPHLQFPLRLLLMLFIPASIGSLLINESLDRGPIVWMPYTSERKTKLVEDGATVLLFGKPSYHVGSGIVDVIIEHPKIRRAFHAGKFKALILEYDNWEGAEIRSLFQEFGHTKHPIVILFSPKRDPVWLDPYSSDNILRHIPRPWSQASSQRMLTILLITSIVWIGSGFWRWSNR